MAMHQQLIPKMSQQLRMTPQLQQAIKLLQLSRMDLINLVQQEMVENPVLEEMQEPYVASKEREAERKKEEAREDDSGVAEVEANANDMDKIDWENYIQSVSSSMPSNSSRFARVSTIMFFRRVSEMMSRFQPESCAASLTFCPPRPIASESWSSGTMSSIVMFISSMSTLFTSAGLIALHTNLADSST